MAARGAGVSNSDRMASPSRSRSNARAEPDGARDHQRDPQDARHDGRGRARSFDDEGEAEDQHHDDGQEGHRRQHLAAAPFDGQVLAGDAQHLRQEPGRVSHGSSPRTVDRSASTPKPPGRTSSNTTRPRRRMTTWSAMAAAARSCVTSTTVRPAVRSAASSPVSHAAPAGSSAAAGSSNSSKRRVVNQRARQRQPLQHAARERPGGRVPLRLAQPHARQQRGRAAGAVGDAVQAREQRDVLGRRQIAVDAGLVPDVADARARRRAAPQHLAAPADLARAGRHQRRQDAQQRRLAGAVRAQHRRDSPRLEGDVDVGQHPPPAVDLADLRQGQAAVMPPGARPGRPARGRSAPGGRRSACAARRVPACRPRGRSAPAPAIRRTSTRAASIEPLARVFDPGALAGLVALAGRAACGRRRTRRRSAPAPAHRPRTAPSRPSTAAPSA